MDLGSKVSAHDIAADVSDLVDEYGGVILRFNSSTPALSKPGIEAGLGYRTSESVMWTPHCSRFTKLRSA